MALSGQKIENRKQNKRRKIVKNKKDLKRNQSVIEKKRWIWRQPVKKIVDMAQTFLKKKNRNRIKIEKKNKRD